MHCSANIGPKGDVALFFGLSGTGKTTLSSVADRQLIGDDEHGWSATRRVQLRGRLLREDDSPLGRGRAADLRDDAALRHRARERRLRSVTRTLDLNDDSLTENTRGAYPLSFIDNAVPSGQGGHPTNVVMLTADAFGVLPPIARLSPAAAMYHFLSGYTAKVAGTERGVTEPKATFSTCFGAPFMVWDPSRLREAARRAHREAPGQRLAREHGLDGRPVRRRIAHEDRAHARDDRCGALGRARRASDTTRHDVQPRRADVVPQRVAADVLKPRETWKDKAAYDAQAAKLAKMFADNFKAFEATAAPEIKAAGPRPDDCDAIREPAVAAGSDRSLRDVEPVIGLEIHAQLLDRDEDLLRLPDDVRCAAEYERLSGVSRAAGRAAGAQPARGRARDQGRAGAQLHRAHRVDLRAQELLLPGPAEGLPDLAVRAAARDAAAGSRCRATARRDPRRHHAHSHGRGRRQVAAPRISRTPIARPISTSTAAACRSSRS